MKKVLISMALLLAANFSFAQEAKLKEANKAANSGDFAKAEQLINEALSNSETQNSADAWNLAGKIQKKIGEKQLENQVLHKPYDTVAFYNSTVNMCKYFFKCDELSEQPDEKGKIKNKYRSSMASAMMADRANLINGGIFYFNSNNEAGNQKALDFFGTYVDMASHPMFEKENLAVRDTLLSKIAYYASLAGLRVKNYAAVEKYANFALNDKEDGETAMELLIAAYKEQNLNDKWVAAVEQAIDKYPNNNTFFANMIDFYSNQDKYDEALAFADKMIAKNPSNYFYPYVKGYLYTNKKDYDKSLEFYKETIEKNPNYAEAYSRIGLIYVIKAQDFSAQATTDVNDPKYAEDNKTLKGFYEAARPYLEKCRQLEPEKRELWYQGLNNVYYNLQMQKEYDEIQK